MVKYLIKRVFGIIPTFLFITLFYFALINFIPGGPVEQFISKLKFQGNMGETSGQAEFSSSGMADKQLIVELNRLYGLDKPLLTRYFLWLKNLLTLNFGKSYTYQEPVFEVILSKMPVSVQFGVAGIILTYLVCIPLGVLKALKDGSAFDRVTTLILFIFYSIPGFVLAVFLIVFFSGESFFPIFPIQGLTSDNYADLTVLQKIWDRIYHFILPIISYTAANYSVQTMLMKNSLLNTIKQDYITTARAKGLSERKVIYKHALKNAFIPIAVNLGYLIGLFFSGSMMIESVFSLDGMGLLAFNSALSRDYPVMMALCFITSMIIIFGRLLSDLLYVLIDPRIDFSKA